MSPAGIPTLSLRFRFTVVLVLVIASLVGLFMVIGEWRIADTVRVSLVQQMVERDALLTQALIPRLRERGFIGLQDTLDTLRTKGALHYLVLRDADGAILASSGWPVGQTLPESNIAQLHQDVRLPDVVHVRLPLRQSGGAIGILHYGVSTELPGHVLLMQRQSLLIEGVAILLVLLGVGWGLMRWMLAPLRLLLEACERIERGEATPRIAARFSDELGRVIAAFNRMAESVQIRLSGLRSAEGRLSAMISEFPAILWVTDADLRITVVEGLGLRSLNIPVDRLRGSLLSEHLGEDPASHPALLAHVRALSGEQGGFTLDFGGRTLQCFVGPLRKETGSIEGVVGLALDITARREAEAAIRDRDRLRQTLLSAIPDMAWLKDHEGRYVLVNEAFIQAIGRPLEEIIGSTDEMLWAQANEGREFRAHDQQVMASRRTLSFEETFTRRDGSVRRLHVTKSPVPGENGRIGGTVGIGRDVTEQRQAEMALRRSEANLAEAQRVARLGSWEWDVRSGVLRWSDEVYRIFGHAPGAFEASYARFLEAIPDEERPTVEAAVSRALETGQLYSMDHRIRLSDGRERRVHEEGLCSYDVEGKPIRMFGIVQDISERWALEQSLLNMQRMYWILSEANQTVIRAPDTTALFHGLCRVLTESGLFRLAWVGRMDGEQGRIVPLARTGEASPYVDGLNISTDRDEANAGPTVNAIRRHEPVVVNDIANDILMWPWAARARDFGLGAMISLPLYLKGEPFGAINAYTQAPGFFNDQVVQLLRELADDMMYGLEFFVARDERESAQRELLELNASLEQKVDERTREAEAINRELEAFSYSVSHDLRAPLRSIDGFSELLVKKQGERLDASGRDYLERIRRATQRMSVLIDDLLKLSRVSRADLHLGEVDISALASDVLEELHSAYPEREVAIHVQTGLRRRADPNLLRIALENLLGNAWKFTSKTPSAQIRVDEIEIEGARWIRIADNGAGFDMKYANKLFTAFQRLHGPQDFEGTGIGLATVQRVIAKHGGQIRVGEAGVGQGASFLLRLAER